MIRNRIKVLILLLVIPYSLIGQLPELEGYKFHQVKVKGNIPKKDVYRLLIVCKDNIFPDSILEYKNLKELHIVGFAHRINHLNRYLKNFPRNICKLTNLISLKLPQHNIKSLPDCINSLDLKLLDLRNNPHISIDNLNCNDSLKSLNLDYCWLDSIPQSIMKFSGLWWLLLRDNNIKYIPENISELKNLNSLFLTGNPLQEYSAIFTLENLTSLSLSECNLDSIPSTISNLTKLKYLNISNNNIRKKEIRKLKKLLPNCEILY